MTPRNTAPRLTPAPEEQVRPLLGMPAAVQSDPDGPLSHMVGQPVLNVLGVIGNHPALLSGVHPMLSALGQGKLSLRDRELMVLRVGYLLRSHYEWAHHVAIGAKAGLTEEEIARVPAGPDAPGWSAHDAALLRAVDELRGPEARISDRTWQQLATVYDAQQLLEVPALIGAYTLLGYILKTCDVAIEDWLTDPADLPEA